MISRNSILTFSKLVLLVIYGFLFSVCQGPMDNISHKEKFFSKGATYFHYNTWGWLSGRSISCLR